MSRSHYEYRYRNATIQSGIKNIKYDPTAAHLNESRQFFVQHIRTLLHVFYFGFRRIFVLSIFDWIHVKIRKFLFCAKERWFDEVYHSVICCTRMKHLKLLSSSELTAQSARNSLHEIYLHSFKLF